MFFATGITFLGLALVGFCLYHYQKDKGRALPWWKWLLAMLWVSLFFLVTFIIGTFIGEGMPQAALPGSLFFGVILLIPGVLLWRLLFSESFLPKKK